MKHLIQLVTTHSRTFIRLIIIGVVLISLGIIATANTTPLAPAPSTPPPLAPVSRQNPDTELALMLNRSPQEPWEANQHRDYAVLQWEQGQAQPLLAYLNTLAQPTAADLPYFEQMAAYFIQQQRWEAARQLLQQSIDISESGLNRARSFYQLGILTLPSDQALGHEYLVAAAIDERFTDHVAELLAAIDAATNDRDAVRRVALLLTDAERWQLADYLWSEFIAAEPMAWQGYTYRGFVRIRINNGQDGLRDLETALGLAPNPTLPLFFLGQYWRSVSEYQSAIEAFQYAYLADPTNAAVAAETALTYQQMGRDVEASQWFDVTISLDSDNVTWHRLRANFYAESNYEIETVGLRLVESSYNLFSSDPHIITSYGYVQYLNGNYTLSRDILERAESLAPDSSRTQYYWGLILERFEDYPGAIVAYQRTIALEEASSSRRYAELARRALNRLGIVS